ncbi:MAG: TRAP transporter substrate-binding protein DctP [Thermoanaerobaculia bacterium]|nr:TRAP transporter substrate-binding protein DctP [Thermoanaerobaculia bacterium]
MTRKLLSAVLLLPLLAAPPAGAAVIKLATLVPDGSVWEKALSRMGSEWREATAGRVQLRIYPGGVAGDEGDVLRKMKIGQLHAATLTSGGLGEIDPAFNVFTIPLFFDSYEELFHVTRELEPLLVRRLEERGYRFLNWGHAGWIHVFSTRRVVEIDDLRQLKIFVGASDDKMAQWWKENGFRAVPLSVTDILTGLQTGMIDVYPATPLAALSLQWFRQTPYMHGLGLAPLVGATVVTERAWERIDEADRRALLTSAESVEARLEKEIPGQDSQAIEEMSKRGLTVVREYDEGAWREAAETFASTMVKLRVPQEIYDRAVAARDAYRGRAAAGGAR